MRVGGNKNAKQYITAKKGTDIKTKYTSNAANNYKERVKKLADNYMAKYAEYLARSRTALTTTVTARIL